MLYDTSFNPTPPVEWKQEAKATYKMAYGERYTELKNDIFRHKVVATLIGLSGAGLAVTIPTIIALASAALAFGAVTGGFGVAIIAGCVLVGLVGITASIVVSIWIKRNLVEEDKRSISLLNDEILSKLARQNSILQG